MILMRLHIEVMLCVIKMLIGVHLHCRFAALNRPVLLPSGVQQHGMKKPTSSCLRQGCKCHHVQCILYIDPVAEHQSLAGLGQVFFSIKITVTSFLVTAISY